MTVECSVCGAPAPDHIHFGGKFPLHINTEHMVNHSYPRDLLLLLSGLLPENSGEDGQDVGDMQDRDKRLRGDRVLESLLRLQI